MSFQPVVIGSGLTAWITLQATRERQEESFNARSDIQRDVERYQSAMQEATTQDDLLSNRSALQVALGAFDLTEDIDNRYFVGRVIAEGTESSTALANLLQDSRYSDLAEAYSPGNFQLGIVGLEFHSADIEANYRTIAFERAVGDVDSDMRLALGFQRTAAEVTEASTNDSAWYQAMANPPVREVFETVFGLPTEFGLLDIDEQHEILKEKAESTLGTDDLSELTQPEKIEEILQSFFVKRQLSEISTSTPLQTALSLVSAIPRKSLLS